MSGGSIWSELGVAPTATESELKKAYARKLRVTQPEDDPDGFVRLRQAYEAALTYVRSGAALYEYDEDDDTASNDTDWPSESQVSHYRPDSLPSTPPSFAAVPEAPELSADGQDMQRANAVFSQASQTFIDGLKHGEGETQLVLLFRDVMQASKQVDLETASAMPRWMAQCLLHFAPASDAILPFTIKYFGWDDEIDPGDDADVIYAILARQRFVGELWDLQSDDHALSAAWIELTAKKSTMARRFGAFFKPELAIKVRTLLDRLDYDLYGLADQVRDDAVTWWRAFLAKPRMYWTHILLSYFGGVGWLPSLLMFKDNATDVVSGLVSIAASLFLIPATPLAILWLQNKNPAWQPGGVQPWHRWLDTYWIATLFLVPPIAWLTASNSSLQNLLVLPVLLAMAAIIVTGDYQRPQSIRQLIKAKAVRFIWPFWVISIVEAGSAELKAGHFALAVASAVLCVMAKNTGGQLLCERWTQYIPKYAASSFLLLAIIYLAAAIALAINTPVYAGYRLVLAVHIAIVVINLLPYLSDADWAKTVLGWGWIALVAIILFASPMLKSANSARALAEPAILSDIPAPALSGLANADADLDLILANFKQSGIGSHDGASHFDTK